MFGRFFSRRKAAAAGDKAAAERKRKGDKAPTLSELEEQIVGPVRALEETAGIDAETAAGNKEKLIQEALRIQRLKQNVFDGLSPEKRQALRLMAEQVMMGGAAAGKPDRDSNE